MSKLTAAMVSLMKAWGWQCLGSDDGLDSRWYKYEKGVRVASFGDGVWSRDFSAARLATGREVEDFEIISDLSAPIRDVLRGLGWRWALASADSGEWFKFNDDGTCAARQGDWIWSEDLATALALAGENIAPEIWKPTMELRFQIRLGSGGPPALQQEWVRTGASEWRDVGYVDDLGSTIV